LTKDDKEKIIRAFLDYKGSGSNFLEQSLYVRYGEYLDGYLKGMIVVGGIDNFSTPYFLAAKVNGKWNVVYHGQEAPPCESVEGYDFPVALAPLCWKGNGTEMVER